MRALLQRVRSSSVSVDDETIASINIGLLILLGIAPTDGNEQIDYLVNKISNLRIFEDTEGNMNLSLLEVKGEAIVVSQFTLYADTRKGRRPSFIKAARPEFAEPLVQRFAEKLNNSGVPCQMGRFGAHMLVEIQNDGPVTIWLERA